MVDHNPGLAPVMSPFGKPFPVATESPASTKARVAPRILLVAQPGEACALYEAALHRTGAQVDTVASIETFYGAVTHRAYNGLVVDIPTKIKALSDHKDLVYSILERFPVIQVNRDRHNGTIRALLYGNHERTGPLESLIQEACWHSPPRKLRSEERKLLHYNVLLSTQPTFDPQTHIRTVTMDVSTNGCFLFASARFQVGAPVWLRFVDLYDKTPVRAVIRHKRRWGQAMVIPGIGVAFETISDHQRRALLNPIAIPSAGLHRQDDLYIGPL